jgi:hypothetical protein
MRDKERVLDNIENLAYEHYYFDRRERKWIRSIEYNQNEIVEHQIRTSRERESVGKYKKRNKRVRDREHKMQNTQCTI